MSRVLLAIRLILHVLYMVVVGAWLVLTVPIRRRLRGPLQPGWSLSEEIGVRLLRTGVHAAAPNLALSRITASAEQPLPPRLRSARMEQTILGERPARLYTPPNEHDASHTILYLHGGGYTTCSPGSHAPITAALALSCARPVWSLDYRLAPEHPHPAAVDDAETAYRALLDRGIPPANILLGGDSAGGGLCLALLIRLRDRGLPLPAGAVCISPWVDLDREPERGAEHCATDYLSPGVVRDYARHYLAGADPRAPTASPLHADLSGLPPLLILAGGAEVLVDDARALHERARDAGVAAELGVYEGMPHVWLMLPWVFERQTEEAVERIAGFARTVG